MPTPRKRARSKPRKFKVGERVRFKYGTRRLRGVIVEDRGPLGGEGRQLYTVRAMFDRSIKYEIVLELPVDELYAA